MELVLVTRSSTADRLLLEKTIHWCCMSVDELVKQLNALKQTRRCMPKVESYRDFNPK
jgi:hypothetical protein